MSMLLSACSSADRRAEQAYQEYQAATAGQDLPAARTALLKLVAAKDDVAEYWMELGKVQTALGAYAEGHSAFSRAYELNRSDPAVLRVLTELAVRSGNLESAEEHARELELVAPGDRWIALTNGFLAARRGRFAEATAQADRLLAASPFDADATMLKARALLGEGRIDAATDVLRKHAELQPSYGAGLRALASLYQRRDDWGGVQWASGVWSAAAPRDERPALLVVEAALRRRDYPRARAASLSLLDRDAAPDRIDSVLTLWAQLWPAEQWIDEVRQRAAEAPKMAQRLSYADFFNQVGRPRDAMTLVAGQAALPVNAGNATANAILAESLALTGRPNDARSRFNSVLAFDPGHPIALRGRAELQLRTGRASAAVVDAQKLVTVLPASSKARLLLARSFARAGEPRQAQKTLWEAFREIPADEQIRQALLASNAGDADAVRRVNEEFALHRDSELNREFL